MNSTVAQSYSSNAYYLDLPHTQLDASGRSEWAVRWRRYGFDSGQATIETEREDGQPASKRPRLEQADDDWLRSNAADAIDLAYAALQNANRDNQRFSTINVFEQDGRLQRELWLFELGPQEQLPLLDGLTEQASGSFNLNNLFPAVSTSARTLAADAPPETVAAYKAFILAVKERVSSLLVTQLETSFDVCKCGDSVLVWSGSTKGEAAACRPMVSLCERGVRVRLDMQPSSLRLVRDNEILEEGAAIVLAPMGLKAEFVRSVPTVKERLVVARTKTSSSPDAEPEQVWWPTSQCLIEGDGAKVSAGLRSILRRDHHRHRHTLERKQLATAAYIEAVARERERERRERQLALAKQQFGVSTPTSTVNTPVAPTEELAPASTPNSMPPQTPKSLGMTSPVTARHALPIEAAQENAAVEEAALMDWNPWPLQSHTFDELGGDNEGFALGLNDADFSFFDDLPDGGLPDVGPFDAGTLPIMEAAEATPAPSLVAGPSPSTHFDVLNASSTSAESPNGRTPHTPFTPFANTVETEQTDLAVPSPAGPYVHLPLAADPGFGAIEFDEDEHFSPPMQVLCSKHPRSQNVSSPPDLRKSGKRSFAMLQRSIKGGRKSVEGCICGVADEKLRSAQATPRSERLEPPSDASSGEESEDQDSREIDLLPSLGSALQRLGTTGAKILNAASRKIEPGPPNALAAMRPQERMKLEFFIGTLTDCVLQSLLDAPESSSDRRSMPLLSLDALPAADASSVQPVNAPQLRLCRRDAVIDVDMLTLRYWQKLELSPWSGEKPVVAYVLDMSGSGADASLLARCAQQVGAKYEASGLGKHTLGVFSHGTDVAGVLRWPADSDVAGIKEALRDAGKRVMMSGMEQKAWPVLYITYSPSHQSRSQQIFDVHRDMFAQSGHGAPSCIALPGSSIAELEALLSPPTTGDASESWPFRIALTSYERIRSPVSRMRLRSEGMPETRWQKMTIATYSPAFCLAQTPSLPKFSFSWPARQLEVLERGRILYVGYTVSDDWEFMGLSAADECVTDRNTRVVWLGQGQETPAVRLRKLLDSVVLRLLFDILPLSKVEWAVVLLRIGSMGSEELSGLRDRLKAALPKAKQNIEVTIGSLRPLPHQQRTPWTTGASGGDLHLLRSSDLTACEDGLAAPRVLSSANGTIASSSDSLFNVQLYDRLSSVQFESTASDEDHHDRVFRSIAQMTMSWQARGPARTGRRLPWFADVLETLRIETAPFVASARDAFAPATAA